MCRGNAHATGRQLEVFTSSFLVYVGKSLLFQYLLSFILRAIDIPHDIPHIGLLTSITSYHMPETCTFCRILHTFMILLRLLFT